MLDHLDEDDLEALRYMAAVLAAGFPLVAFLQVLHVYGQALRQIADAEARLFRHLRARAADQGRRARDRRWPRRWGS